MLEDLELTQEILGCFRRVGGKINRLHLNRILPAPYAVKRDGAHLVLCDRDRDRVVKVLGENALSSEQAGESYYYACAVDLLKCLRLAERSTRDKGLDKA